MIESPSENPVSSDPLAAWTFGRLSELKDENFGMDCGDGHSEILTLIEVTSPSGAASPHGRIPFSLVFRSSSREFYLPQGCRQLDHPSLGQADVFLVPIGPDASGMRFEAVFN